MIRLKLGVPSALVLDLRHPHTLGATRTLNLRDRAKTTAVSC